MMNLDLMSILFRILEVVIPSGFADDPEPPHYLCLLVLFKPLLSIAFQCVVHVQHPRALGARSKFLGSQPAQSSAFP
jgi:hypothetical protein